MLIACMFLVDERPCLLRLVAIFCVAAHVIVGCTIPIGGDTDSANASVLALRTSALSNHQQSKTTADSSIQPMEDSDPQRADETDATAD